MLFMNLNYILLIVSYQKLILKSKTMIYFNFSIIYKLMTNLYTNEINSFYRLALLYKSYLKKKNISNFDHFIQIFKYESNLIN
jgi:hypothetical protein